MKATMTRAYGAYGERLGKPGHSRTAFTGEVPDDATGWYMLGARAYSPTLRRFLAPDPASPSDGGGCNRYAYCEGDPINRIDPTGNISWNWISDTLGRNLSALVPFATGGLLRAASAPTGMVAAISSPSMIATMTASTADVGPVSSALGSVVSRQTHDANDEFGWLVASAGESGGDAMTVGEQGTSAAGFSPGIGSSGASASPSRQSVKNYAFGRGKYRIRVREEALSMPWKLVTYPGSNAPRLEPNFREIANRNGGINYAADSPMNHTDIDDVMMTIREKQDDLPVLVLSGVHGRPDGKNYFMGKRKKPDLDLYQTDFRQRGNWSRLSGRSGNRLKILDMGSRTADQFTAVTQKRAHIVHASCFAAVDRYLMKAHGVTFMEAFSP